MLLASRRYSGITVVPTEKTASEISRVELRLNPAELAL
jgi:hypothetical protein